MLNGSLSIIFLFFVKCYVLYKLRIFLTNLYFFFELRRRANGKSLLLQSASVERTEGALLQQSALLQRRESALLFRSTLDRALFGGWYRGKFCIGWLHEQTPSAWRRVNKPFKDYTKQCYERFMVDNVDAKKVCRLDIAKWTEEAWNKISVDTIRNTWTSIGFINTN